MSYTAIVAALKTAFEGVTGIAYVLDYEPKAIHDTPMLYLLLDALDRDDEGPAGVRSRYEIMATLVVRWQDNEAAEQEVIALMDPVAGALDADITLGGMNGFALVTRADAGYATISGTLYRIVEFTVTAEEVVCV